MNKLDKGSVFIRSAERKGVVLFCPVRIELGALVHAYGVAAVAAVKGLPILSQVEIVPVM